MGYLCSFPSLFDVHKEPISWDVCGDKAQLCARQPS